jgi:hypothetical protein
MECGPRARDDDHWQPRVGDRVRVRAGVGSSVPTCDEMMHRPEEAGATGQVVAMRALPGAPGHPCLVLFDAPLVAMRQGAYMSIGARHYAADELEPA